MAMQALFVSHMVFLACCHQRLILILNSLFWNKYLFVSSSFIGSCILGGLCSDLVRNKSSSRTNKRNVHSRVILFFFLMQRVTSKARPLPVQHVVDTALTTKWVLKKITATLFGPPFETYLFSEHFFGDKLSKTFILVSLYVCISGRFM